MLVSAAVSSLGRLSIARNIKAFPCRWSTYNWWTPVIFDHTSFWRQSTQDKVTMHFTKALLFVGAALAAPTPEAELEERATQQCGQYQTQSQGGYTLATNGWGWQTGTGSQCSQINSVSGSTVAWDTTWTWSGGPTSVKSYTNVQQNSYARKPLSQYTSMPTTWKWTLTGSNLNSNGRRPLSRLAFS